MEPFLKSLCLLRVVKRVLVGARLRSVQWHFLDGPRLATILEGHLLALAQACKRLFQWILLLGYLLGFSRYLWHWFLLDLSSTFRRWPIQLLLNNLLSDLGLLFTFHLLFRLHNSLLVTFGDLLRLIFNFGCLDNSYVIDQRRPYVLLDHFRGF